MSLNNIAKAFEIIDKTYENVEKLMKYCDSIAEDNGYISMSDRFLRYKSDKDYEGWMTRIFVKLYQRQDDMPLENEWLDGPVYAMFIRFYDEAAVYVSKYDYKSIESWNKGASPSDFWGFTWPIEDEVEFTRSLATEDETVSVSMPTGERVSSKYWGLQCVKTMRHELMDINKDNVSELIFKGFDRLRNL